MKASLKYKTGKLLKWANHPSSYLFLKKKKINKIGGSQETPCLCLLLDYNIIHSKHAPEAQLSMCLDGVL